jgi:two-component system, OmpR family, response regulator QseB
MNSSSYIIVEQGTPYEKGAFIPITLPKTVIGRKSKDWTPDIPFQNIHVSREHLAIHCNEAGEFFIEDLDSKHGTWLNHRPLPAIKIIPLKNSDIISLAGGLIKFSFTISSLELTADFSPMMPAVKEDDFKLDSIKQELTVQGKACVFSEKEFKCIEILLQNREQFTPAEEVKKSVWPERVHSGAEIPDVSPEEVNALMYRIRKKAPEIIYIENIRGKGFQLSIK